MTITNREVIEEFKDAQAQAQTGGRQVGGGPSAADQDAAGGSSGEGGYGAAQIDSLGRGEDGGRHVPGDGLSRGERFDLEQGGGRGDDALDADGDADAALDPDEPLRQDQREHQDQGQRWIDEHGGAPDGSDRQA